VQVLIVKLSSLGDVVHAMPAVQDLRAALPQARIDWVVERAFAPLVARCEGVQAVIACELRRWRKSPFARDTREAWRVFRRGLRASRYDAILDLQGLTKSALVARAARLAPAGQRFALGNQTEGAGWELPTRLVADVAIALPPRIDAVLRSRELCARALGYAVQGPPRFGLRADTRDFADERHTVCFVHGTSREDKCWPEQDWVLLGRRLAAQGFRIGLPQGSAAERARSERLAAAIGPQARAWESMDLGRLTDRLGACAGVIGVDSGLSHIAVALDRPHVQIYNFDTAWRTGPLHGGRQKAVFARPQPTLEAVWRAWQDVAPAEPRP